MRKLYRDVLVTTTSSLEGWQIHEYLSPVSAHIVAGTNIFSDIFASFSDIFGGRSGTYQKQLQTINDAAIQTLQKQTIALGGNCVLAARIDHDEISGGGKSMFLVTASGTAVYAERLKVVCPQNDSVAKTLGHNELKLLENKQQLLEKAKENHQFLSKEDWINVFENQWIELIPYFFKVIHENLVNKYNNNTYSKEFLEHASTFWGILPFNIAQNLIFQRLKSESDSHMLMFLNTIISDLNLLDYEQLESIIRSGAFNQQKNALQLSLQHRFCYNPQDIEKIKSLIEVITTSFPNRGQEKAKNALLSSKVKNIWACECGASQPENQTYCKNCHKDIQGFVEKELKPADAISGLNERLKILVEYF